MTPRGNSSCGASVFCILFRYYFYRRHGIHIIASASTAGKRHDTAATKAVILPQDTT